jgi:hypothetical protein
VMRAGAGRFPLVPHQHQGRSCAQHGAETDCSSRVRTLLGHGIQGHFAHLLGERKEKPWVDAFYPE